MAVRPFHKLQKLTASDGSSPSAAGWLLGARPRGARAPHAATQQQRHLLPLAQPSRAQQKMQPMGTAKLMPNAMGRLRMRARGPVRGSAGMPVKLVRVEVSLGAGGACRRRRAAPPPLLPPAALATAPWKGPASISASNGAARRTSSGASISPMSNGLKSAASSFLMAAWSGRRMAAKGFSVELGVNLLPEALGCKEVQPEKLPRWRGLSSKVDFTMQVW